MSTEIQPTPSPVLAVSLTDRTLTVLMGSPPKPYAIDREHPRFEAAKTAVKDPNVNMDQLLAIFAPADLAARYAARSAAVSVVNGQLYLDGEEVHNHLAQRMLDASAEGFDISYWEAFARSAAAHPDPYVFEGLLAWLEIGNMPLTSDGGFLAFKYVDQDYRSIHADTDGTRYDHTPGNVVRMDRDRCDTNRNAHCSTGLHFCSLGYLPQYNSSHKIVLLKVFPVNVTSFPTDTATKGRCCEYEVLADVTENYQHMVFAPIETTYDEPTADEAELEAELARDYPEDPNGYADVDDAAAADDEEERSTPLDEQVEVDAVVEEAGLTPYPDGPVVNSDIGPITPERFGQLIEEHGTQSKLAKALGKSAGTVAAWKRKLTGG